MEKARKKRAPLRTSFTKTLSSLKKEIDGARDKGLILDSLTKLENLMTEIKILDDTIIDLMSEDIKIDEALITKEVEETENYSDEFITAKRRVNEVLNVNISNSVDLSNNENSASTIINSKFKRYQLPKLNIKPFDSKLINYLPFWAQFKKIHQDEEIDDCDKFQYLLQSVETGTRARDLLESYPITSENYSKALQAFQERYGNKDTLIEVYVREFLKLITANIQAGGKGKLSLCDLVTKVEAHLRSLESMGLNTENNSAWLYPMVESCLPEDILRVWQRYVGAREDNSSSSSEADIPKSNLSLLMKFLKQEVTGEERLQLARSGFESLSSRDKIKERFHKRDKYPTAAGLFATKELSCLFCGKPHESKDCVSARSLSLEVKRNKVREKNCCLKCLRFGHRANLCKIFVKCHVCAKPHTELFCPAIEKRGETSNKIKTPEFVQNTYSNQRCSQEVALMTIELIVKGREKDKRVRALLDCGSQRSYILRGTAKELQLKPLSNEMLAHTVFGGAQIEAKPHSKYKVSLLALGSQSRGHTFEFLDQEKICGEIPRIPKGHLCKELKKNKIWLSDMGPGNPEIELLIGSDIYGKILTGRIKQLDNGLTAIQTKLGWTVCGKTGISSKSNVNSGATMLMTNLYVKEFSVPDLWRLETIGINDPAQTLTKREEEELAQDMFLKQLTRNEDGRYRVGLPWTCKDVNIPSNRNEAERRLFSTTRRLKKMNKFEDYDLVFREWQKENIIQEVSKEELEEVAGHYLCHHPVLKPDSTTFSIRPVFDASCKIGRAPALNDCLFKGPNLLEEIPAILLRFREKAIAVVSDIRRAFLQIEIKEEDRHFLRFLWWEKKDEIKVFQHNRVVFGISSSPFLLGAVIKTHLNKCPEELKVIALKLQKSFYVDNCVTSVDSTSELEEFMTKATEIMAEAKMDLRLWQFGPIEEIEGSSFQNINEDLTTPVPVLGIRWDREDDSLMICNKFDIEIENPSKRQILSITQGIYDPIGFLAPALLPAKLLIQEAWSSKSEWDIPLPEKLQNNFKKWYSELKQLSKLKIKRRIGYGNKEQWSLHIFCDASQSAYATVIFLRCEEDNRVSVQFLGAKSRLAPKRTLTIPRLELLACVLGARLANYIIKALDIFTVPAFCWTDSSTVLAWIKRNDQWGTFVGNRIKEICKLTDPHQWYLVPGNLNPADLPSRGCSPKYLIDSGWWEGPKWLEEERNNWPQQRSDPNEDLIMSERKKSAVSLLACTKVDPFMNYERISKFCRIVNIICWIKRFVTKCRNKNFIYPAEISVEEKENAEKFLWHRLQLESFGGVGETVKGLVVMTDQDNIIRVKTKLLDREDSFSFKYPILLPSKHHVVRCLIRNIHLKNCHAGLQTVGSILRENFWIISAKRNIRSELSKCMKCKRFSSKPFVTPPIHLPFDRVRDSKVFEVTGIDLCGPLFLKNKSKVWIVIFTCAVYRAIHLELVTNLSTEGFIFALRRFISRRGRISIIYSDNGTNFRGTNNLLKSLNWSEIENCTDIAPIKWKFIPPTAAWWGGWWERLIRSVKNLLLRTLGKASLNFEDLSTILCEVEATMNNRPLTYISEESDIFTPLTPSAFLQEIPEIGIPDLEKISSQKLRKRYKKCQNIKDQLRNRFRKEYLSGLVQRSREKGQTIQTDDVVLMELRNQKRLEWPIGRVVKIFESRDGCARVAEIKTATGTFVRPIRKLYPLEIADRNDPVIQMINFQKTFINC